MVSFEEDLERYDLVIAPVMYMVKEGQADRLKAFVDKGGTFVTTFFSGIVNENDLVTLGGYPGELRDLVGIWAEEMDALEPEKRNEIVLGQPYGALQGEYKCQLLFDLIHAETASVLATYGSDFYQGMPVLTRNRYGKGNAYYVASSPDQQFLQDFMQTLLVEKGIKPEMESDPGVEVISRGKDGEKIWFVMNHNAQASSFQTGTKKLIDLLSGQTFSGTGTIAGREVYLLKEDN